MRPTSVLFAFSITLGTGLEARGQGTPGAAENLVRLHEAWGPRASTPGASLVIKESTRSGQTIKFRLMAEGVPKDGVYSLLAWSVTQKGPVEVIKGVTLDVSGLAVCAGRPGTCGSTEKPNDPIDVTLQPIRGEPVRLGLVSADGATKVLARIVPVPLRGVDKGCTADATLLTPGAELVLIEGSGLPSNSELTMESGSGGERNTIKGKVDSEGHYSSAILPYRQGPAGGITKVTLQAAGCAPSVGVPWGRSN